MLGGDAADGAGAAGAAAPPPAKRHIGGLSGRALGLTLIFLTAIIWVAASFISQLLVGNAEAGADAFHVPPLLLTYLSTSVFTLFLPLVQLRSLLRETALLRRSFRYKPLDEDAADADAADAAGLLGNDGDGDDDDEELRAGGFLAPGPGTNGSSAAAAAGRASARRQAGGAAGAAAAAPPGSLQADLDQAEAAAAAEQASALSRASAAAHREALRAAAQCFLLWFAAQFLFNVSLSLTSVTSNTILSSASSLFTFALSMVVLKEPYSAAKLCAIAACMGGTLLVTLADEESAGASAGGGGGGMNVAAAAAAASAAAGGTAGAGGGGSNATTPAAAAAAAAAAGPSHSVLGDVVCLASAALYAGYTIVLRRSLPDEDEANVALFFGYVGLLCSAVFAPLVAVLAGIGAMHLQAIPAKAYAIIAVEGVLNYCLSDYLWAHAVLLLGPTVATLGLSVQIPVAAAVEALYGHPKWMAGGRPLAMTLAGTALIVAGFFVGNLAQPAGSAVPGSHHSAEQEEAERRRQQRADGDGLSPRLPRSVRPGDSGGGFGDGGGGAPALAHVQVGPPAAAAKRRHSLELSSLSSSIDAASTPRLLAAAAALQEHEWSPRDDGHGDDGGGGRSGSGGGSGSDRGSGGSAGRSSRAARASRLSHAHGGSGGGATAAESP